MKVAVEKPNSIKVTPAMIRQAEALVRDAHANGGLAPLELEAFWADQEVARQDPFGNIPQAAIGNLWSAECIFDELGIPEDWHRYYHDPAWVTSMARRYNDRAEQLVGRRLLNETRPDPTMCYPAHKQLHDIFEAENVFHNESFWLRQSADNEEELVALLDRVDRRLADLRLFLLPDNWDVEKSHLLDLGVQPPLYRSQRGPVTFATSIYGVENLMYLMYDEPELAKRFSQTILRAMLEMGRVLDEEAGYTDETAPRGFSFCDDNCYLMPPAMYEQFGYPILQGMFERYAPDPGDWRYQHSDSAMGHLLPLLADFKLSMCNFGPTVMAREIRKHMPQTIIQGQLAPFTYSRNDEVGMVAEFLRDFEQVGDSRGLLFATAGSVNNGSRLSGLRLIMAAVQRYGRYA